MHPISQLFIGHLNVFHLFNKVHDLSAFLKSFPCQLFGVTETRLTSDVNCNIIDIPEYDVVRRDSSTVGQTGIAVYIHHSIRRWTLRRTDLESQAVECLWLEINSESSSSLLVGILYRNPASALTWHDDFVEMMDKVAEVQDTILLLGDFNIDMSKHQPAWESTMNLFGIDQMVKSPTRVTPSSSTLLDHIYTNCTDLVSDICVPSVGISDHFPTLCKISIKLPKFVKKTHTTIHYRSLKNFDEQNFVNDLRQAGFHSVFSTQDPNEALDLWCSLFLQVAHKHAPLRKKRVKHATLPPWLTQDIMHAMRVRDTFKKNKDFVSYKIQRNRVKSLVREAKKTYFKNMIENNRDTSTIWRAINTFTKNSQRLVHPPSHLSADTFNDHFLSVPNINFPHKCPLEASVDLKSRILHLCDKRLTSDVTFSIPPLTINEVVKLVTKLKNNSSMDLNGINSYLLKVSLPVTVVSLTYVYSLCIEQNIYPTAFQNAKIIPLPKARGASHPNDYRPISILSVLSKPLEKHIHHHLSDYFEKYDLFHPLQSGFRPNHSCQSTVSRLTNVWLSAVNTFKMSGSVFLDLTKAFDLVNHNILLDKLSLYLKNDAVLAFFSSYLAHRTQCVYLNGMYSSCRKVKTGVPQGSILGPLLFCIYINDLPLHITDPEVHCDMFADDTILHSSSRNLNTIQGRLQKSLSEVDMWCRSNAMVINPSKTKCMLLTTRQKKQRNPLRLQLDLSENAIEQVSEHRVLGIIIDDTFRWESHLNHTCKVISRNLFLLSKLKHFLDTSARKLFFHAHIMSHINYSSVIWDGCSDVHFKKINSLYRRAVKLILTDSPLTTDEKFAALNLLPLSEHLVLNKCTFMHKIHVRKAPLYLCQFFQKPSTGRLQSEHNFILPQPRIDLFKSSLSYSGVYSWNALPLNIKGISSHMLFKKKLHEHFTQQRRC